MSGEPGLLSDAIQEWLRGEIDLHKRVPLGGSEAEAVNALVARLEERLTPLLKESISISREAFETDSRVAELIELAEGQRERLHEVRESAGASLRASSEITAGAEELGAQSKVALELASAGSARQTGFVTGMQLISSIIAKGRERTARLKQDSQSIRDLMGILEDLAARLDILSINASIEAARNGAAGRGFAVIAHEMRNLQSRTRESTEKAVGRLSGVLGGIEEMDGELGKAEAAALRGLNDATGIGTSLHDLEGHAAEVSRSALAILGLARGQESQGRAVERAAAETDAAGRGISERALMARDGAKRLHDVVESLDATISGFRFSWHHSLEASLEQAISLLGEPRQIGGLSPMFRQYPYFELFYLMDAQGIQVSQNLRRKAHGLSESDDGARGADRSHTQYFSGAISQVGACFTGIYVSSATGTLCITVSKSCRLGAKDYVLAADIDLGVLLESKGAAQPR